MNNIPYESFESDWDNDTYLTALGSVVAALYTYADAATQAFEAFEGMWDNNVYLTSLGSVVAAQYDTQPEAFEDFEEEWTLTMST